MAHRRVKEVDYDDDDLDYDQEEEEGMSADDKKQLEEAVATVRLALEGEFDIPQAELEETVWHYYFDVPKSVAYLRKKRAPPEPKPQKQAQPSRFDQAAQNAQNTPANALWSDLPTPFHGIGSRSKPTQNMFKDVPWLHVPPERLGNITEIPLLPRGRLLGGSGKPSKLAALAAARKKAAEERKQNEESRKIKDEENQDASIALLDRLRLQSEPPTPGSEDGPSSNKRGLPDDVHIAPRSYPRPKRDEPVQESPAPAPVPASPPHEQPLQYTPQDLRVNPSTFASTMLGQHIHSQSGQTGLFRLPSLQPKTSSNAFAGPSPDDVVKSAQTKVKKPATKSQSTDQTPGVTGGVEKLALTDAPPPRVKSKNIDVAAEFEKTNAKPAANFVVIGHVDHGKSTLMGRLLYDLKLVNERSYGKLKNEANSIGKSSFALAWVMDATSEERARGVTVDIATNYFETDKTRFTILDAPGHRDFIPNMIAGTAQADFAILVIDASTNAFEAGQKGQTKEHALLARSMGIARLIIAVNKMDAAEWSEARFTEISQQMTAFLTGAGFQPKNLTFVPCAGLTGVNVATPPADNNMPWYKEGTLVDALESFEPARRALRDPLRLTINDVFRGGAQHPLSISGRLDAGSVQTGEQILAMPANERATVRAVEVDGEPREWAVAGQISTLHLDDIDPIHLRSGDIICSATLSSIKNVKAFTAKVLAFEHIIPGAIEMHRGRMHAAARFSQLLAVLNKATGAVEKKKPRVVQPGALARVRIELETALPLEAAGRVVFRHEGTTTAAGLIESVDMS